VAVGIADWIGGNVDTTTSVCHGPSGMAFQGVGEVTASLGEVRNRGDLIMFWGSNPAESHPRHFTKYSLMPKGQFLPNGRKDRTAVISMSAGRSRPRPPTFRSNAGRLEGGGRYALANDVTLDPAQVVADRRAACDLAGFDDHKKAKFGVVFWHGVTMTRGKHANSEAALALTRDMNEHTRFVCVNRGCNVTGADNGHLADRYPFGVNLGRGCPRFNPVNTRLPMSRPRRGRRRPDRRQRPDG
jgi:formylmethanofuran dehydrogenase subunit B